MNASGEPAPARGGAFDYRGSIRWVYRPQRDRDADPGEIVWAWVAYEDDPRVGKDRPLAIIGFTQDKRLAALMLSSRDRTGDARWMSIGRGSWDREGRESWVRCDRVLAVHAGAVRREGATIPRRTYDDIAMRFGARSRPDRVRILARLRNLLRGRR